MDDLAKFRKVNQAESLQELASVILSFADANNQIQGSKKLHDANKMADVCRYATYENIFTTNGLTREYGIRQQAIYLLTSNKFRV